MSSTGQITRLLAELRGGNRAAEEQLVPLVYQELRRLARAYMRKERVGHTLQTTALVHEAYIKLLPQEVSWKSRAHIMGIAAQQMRRVLIDYARKRKAEKRDGEENRIRLDEAIAMAREQPAQLVALEEALGRFGSEHSRQCQVVELRFFGGYLEEEVSKILNISVETVKRDWRFAKAWLSLELRGKKEP